MNPLRGGWVILVTVIAAMALAIVRAPLAAPDWLQWLRPDWVLAVFFFWAIAAPQRVGVVTAWITGLVLDALLAAPLGLGGICLALSTYGVLRVRNRLHMYSLVQQTAVLLAVALVVHVVNRSVLAYVRDVDWWTLALVAPALATALVYPLLALVLGALARRFRVQ